MQLCCDDDDDGRFGQEELLREEEEYQEKRRYENEVRPFRAYEFERFFKIDPTTFVD